MSSTCASPLAPSPSSTGSVPVVILLKERHSPSSGTTVTHNQNGQDGTHISIDTYEDECIRHSIRAHFIPPITFEFIPSAIEKCCRTLLWSPFAPYTWSGIIATSPRGVEALLQIIHTISGYNACKATLDQIAAIPIFVLSQSSAERLVQDPVAARYGIKPTVFPYVTNAAQLGVKIREWAAARTDTSNGRSQKLVVLVGNQRRDDLFQALQDTSIEVEEVVVYRTVPAPLPNPTSVSTHPTPFMSKLLGILPPLQNSAIDSAAASSSTSSATVPSLSPIYITFFSPSGVETFFAHIRYYEQMIQKQANLLRLHDTGMPSPPSAEEHGQFCQAQFRYACIGQTSATALRAHFSATSLAPPPRILVAEKPNAEELIRCIREDLAHTSSSIPAALPSPASSSCSVPFFKYHGTLNDYVLIDGFVHFYSKEQLQHLARIMCHSRRGAIGSDGLLYVTSGKEVALGTTAESLREFDPSKENVHGRMYMFNTDGSEAEMCGNGLRCVAKFVHDHKYFGLQQDTLNLLTGAGLKIAHITRGTDGLASAITIDIGRPVQMEEMVHTEGFDFGSKQQIPFPIHVHDVSMGNPHSIVIIGANSPLSIHADQRLGELDVNHVGKMIHDLPRYRLTNGSNVSFASVRECLPSFVPPLAFGATFATPSTDADSSVPSASSTTCDSSHVATVDIRTYERGNGETWSCGTGISATVSSILARSKRNSSAASSSSPSVPYTEIVRVLVRGGELRVRCELRDRSNGSHSPVVHRDILSVHLSGLAQESFRGCFNAKW